MFECLEIIMYLHIVNENVKFNEENNENFWV